MPVATNESSSIPQPRPMVRRKPAPSIVLDARYPCPDPDDPFAPLSVLRTRTASTLGLLSFAGDSTSHLPTLPYTGGSPFPPDPYQITPPTSPILSPAAKIGATFSTRSTFDISQNLLGASQSPSELPNTRTFSTPKRRRSRSAVSRKEARSSTFSGSGTSPYGHTNLQAYVLASSRFPSPPYSAEPLGRQQTANGSMLSLGIPLCRHDSAPVLSLMSAAQKSTFPADSSRSRVGKLARLLPKRTRSGLSLAEFPSENIKEKHRLGFPLTPGTPVSPKEKHVPEENMFRPRRKSSTLLPLLVATNMQSLDVSDPSTGASIYESTTDELGCMSSPSSTTLHSPSIHTMSHVSELTPLTPKKRPQTMQLQQRVVDLTESLQQDRQAMRPSTAPSNSPLSFDENALPTKRQLLNAASYNVVAENGLRVPFGDLFRDQKTVVIFIRHFWCPLCQDYMSSIANTVDPQTLKQSGINLVIISNGSYNMIKSYRQIFRMPYAVYTDPSSRLYGILGMTLKSIEPKAKRHRGSYVKHGRAAGIAMVIANALRVGMPVWEKGGDATQLGGEFVLGPGVTASYAHRMPTRSSHAPIVQALAAAGLPVYSHAEKPKIIVSSDAAGRASIILDGDEDQWMEERRRSLARIRERKQARRLGLSVSVSGHSDSEQEIEVGHVGRRIPDRLHARQMARTDSIAEEEEEHTARTVESAGSPLRGSTDIDDSNDSTEDDTDHSSVDTRTLAGSDTVSEILGNVGHSSKHGAVEMVHGLSPLIPILT